MSVVNAILKNCITEGKMVYVIIENSKNKYFGKVIRKNDMNSEINIVQMMNGSLSQHVQFKDEDVSKITVSKNVSEDVVITLFNEDD